MDEDIRQLIFQAIDQTISPADFDRLQDAIDDSDDVRAQYLRAVRLSESLHEIAAETEGSTPEQQVRDGGPFAEGFTKWDLRSPKLLAFAAAILVAACGTAFWIGQRNVSPEITRVPGSDPQSEMQDTEESLIAGHATLRRSVDLNWSGGVTSYHEGDVLPDGLLEFDEGVAEIDFFCGATLVVEGPAALDIESDWSVRVINGRLRANVPPAARGFIVKAADSEIVDLGTEFALEVRSENARVEVIDGEVELRGGEHDGSHLVTGQKQWLKGTQTGPESFQGLSTVNDLQRRREDAERQRFAESRTYSQELRTDKRLIAFYPITEMQTERVVHNAAPTGDRFDGQLVGPAKWTTGRFGTESGGLEFDRPGARVRTRIDGEFQAFTFACWVRIYSLEHRYNALFMSDSYETGELHWQIRDDGCLMFSVMVDDTQDIRHFNQIDQRIVRAAGLHRVYYTKPFWDITKSGQWFHIAAVYDPVGRQVSQFVNGELLSSEKIIDRFHITRLRIGPAEIGNWGQPFRKTPWFAVRNLNGTIDELAIFNAVLSADEIKTLHAQGKPLGY